MTNQMPQTATDQDSEALDRDRAEGHVIECDGTEARVSALAGTGADAENYWAVGQLISIQVGKNRVVGLLYKVENGEIGWDQPEKRRVTLFVELSGEVRQDERRGAIFSGGIS